jgi:phosphoenolpyruvate-protein kinase (PTS system EI component)
MMHIHAMPYAPDRARGRLRRVSNPELSGAIALLYPTEIDQLHGKPAGLVVIDGAPFSHTMIAVLRWGIPTVIVSKEQASALSEEMLVIIDGGSGIITSDRADEAVREQQSSSLTPGEKQVLTADGETVVLLSSIRDAEGARNSVIKGASAIGLVRTEYLYPGDGSRPDQAFYERTIGEICSDAETLPVTIRLLDVSPDKYPPWLSPIKEAKTPLGLQGVRLFDTDPVGKVIKAQMDAIYSLSSRYQLRLIIPFLSRYEEILYWRDHLRRVMPEGMPLGAMVETPSGALDIARWLDAVDFVAVGCNDLMQSVFAADRDQPILKSYLDPYAPVLFRLFKQMAESVEGKLDHVQLCGLLPQFAGVMPILLGLGYRVFSVEAMLIPHLAHVIRGTSIQSAQTLAKRVCDSYQSRDVIELLGY